MSLTHDIDLVAATRGYSSALAIGRAARCGTDTTLSAMLVRLPKRVVALAIVVQLADHAGSLGSPGDDGEAGEVAAHSVRRVLELSASIVAELDTALRESCGLDEHRAAMSVIDAMQRMPVAAPDGRGFHGAFADADRALLGLAEFGGRALAALHLAPDELPALLSTALAHALTVFMAADRIDAETFRVP